MLGEGCDVLVAELGNVAHTFMSLDHKLFIETHAVVLALIVG